VTRRRAALPVAASDGDLPLNQLTWELGPGAPAGVTINPQTGVLNWMPGETLGPGEYPVMVTVRDNGTPVHIADHRAR
jgi:hypothetical protein